MRYTAKKSTMKDSGVFQRFKKKRKKEATFGVYCIVFGPCFLHTSYKDYEIEREYSEKLFSTFAFAHLISSTINLVLVVLLV